MEIREITNKERWDDFLNNQLYTIFVQSSSYANFFKAMGENTWFFGIFEKDKLLGGSLVASTHAKRGDFLFLPYGPIFDQKMSYEKTQELLKTFFDYLKNFAKEKKYDFIRVSPFIEDTKENKKLFTKLGFLSSPMHILAENTWILDITKSEEVLLMDMKKNHRNLIRRCEKKGVKIKKERNIDGLKEFNKIHDETAKRHNFHRFSDKYVEKEFKEFSKNDQSLIFKSFLPDGRLDSSSIIMFYGNMAAYRHSGSLSLDNKLPTSYLLQWEAIKEAKKRGIKYYNFWGVAPENSKKKHPFRGITHFKKGFGGFSLDLIHCMDLKINNKYYLTWIIEYIRKIKRGF